MGRLNRILYVMLKFTERPKTPGMTSKENIAFPEGNKLFAGDFVLIWMKQTLIWFNLQRNGTRNGLSNIKETFAATNVSSAPTYEHFPVMLVSQVHMMAGKNVKKKYLMCQIPIKMLKKEATPNSSLHNLKIYYQKGAEKLAKNENM